MNFSLSQFDGLEKEVGGLCGEAKTDDICDAHVALVASKREEFLYTSDPEDMERLSAKLPGCSPIIISCSFNRR